jgi:hypothetical protein
MPIRSVSRLTLYGYTRIVFMKKGGGAGPLLLAQRTVGKVESQTRMSQPMTSTSYNPCYLTNIYSPNITYHLIIITIHFPRPSQMT